MFRVDDITAAQALPVPEMAGPEGFFTEGVPGVTQATRVRASWLNMVQEELCSILTAAGMTHNKTSYNQVVTAIQTLISQSSIITDTGVANAYSGVNVTPLTLGTLKHGTVQEVQCLHANTGASTYAPDGLAAKPIYGLGMQPLQGGEIVVNGICDLLYFINPAVNSGNGVWILLSSTGGSLQVAPGTHTSHAVNMGQLAALSTSLANRLQFDSIAALRLNTAPSSQVYSCGVTSYYGSTSTKIQPVARQFDYYIQPTDTTSIDNGWSIIVDAAGNRWYAIIDKQPSVVQLGAIPGDAASGTIAFAITEASNIDSWYVPAGTFISGQPLLTKNYVGPGSVVATNGVTHNGTTRNGMLKKISGLAFGNALQFSNFPRAVTIIGDSITSGTGASVQANSYPAVLQKLLNNSLPFGQGSYQSGGMFNTVTLGGSYTRGTNGPGRNSVILAPGGTITFTADYIDTVVFYFTRAATGVGTLTLTSGGTTLGSQVCTGAPGTDVLGILTQLARGGKGVTYTITCSVAPVEVTGISAFHALSGAAGSAGTNPYFISVQGFSGYNTNNFTPAPVIASLVAQNPYPQFNFEIFILAIGTNDIFNVSTANTSAQYKANLSSIITQLRAATGTSCTIILQVPLNARSDFRTPVLEPFENYREAIYQLARQFDLDVMDLSELDLLTVGATSDGLHPNDFGHSIIASAWYEKLFGTLVTTPRVDPIVPVAPVTAVAGTLLQSTMTKGGVVNLSGQLLTSNVTSGTQIASVALSSAPLQQKVLIAPYWNGTGTYAQGAAILSILPSGSVVLYGTSIGPSYSATGNPYISLDGLSYVVS
ncbi:GDSL-type esterase/lipase family protein [Undibacterium sp. SXout20W]|uniref:SGNH/GDSL hydrolase family protein n=1 Tax=Undibacterium sp. SXout20W TaxID=3413051 RepID=UPI003BF0AABA